MANLFSDVLTTRDSLGGISDPGTYAGQVIVTRSVIDLAANVNTDDVLLMLDIPSNAKPQSLCLFNDDLGTDSSSDFGIYAGDNFTDTDVSKTEYLKNDVINVNAFADASTELNSSNLDGNEQMRFRASGSSSVLSRLNEAMWQLADLDSDPQVNLRIGIAIPTIWTVFSAGQIVLICEYTVK